MLEESFPNDITLTPLGGFPSYSWEKMSHSLNYRAKKEIPDALSQTPPDTFFPLEQLRHILKGFFSADSFMFFRPNYL